MPKNEVKSTLFDKLGKRLTEAHNQHKDDETEYGGGFAELPAGLSGAVAQLVECKFDTFKTGKTQGEPYFIARGVVVSPKEFAGQYIEGMQTQIGPEPICDTPDRTRKTVEDHIAWIYNELRKLGLDTTSLEPNQLELACEELKNAAPYFRFRTWKGQKQQVEQKNGKFYVGQKAYDSMEALKKANPYIDNEPRVNHDWDRAIEWSGGDSPGSGLVDNLPSTNGQGTEHSHNKVTTSDDNEEPNLDQLAADAEMGDDDARKKLHTIAMAAGMTQDEFDSIDKWADLPTEIQNRQEADDNGKKEDNEVQVAFKPVKGKMYKFKPNDPATKKPVKKAVEVEAIKVDEAKRTVDLKRTDTKQLLRGVKWDDLEK